MLVFPIRRTRWIFHPRLRSQIHSGFKGDNVRSSRISRLRKPALLCAAAFVTAGITSSYYWIDDIRVFSGAYVRNDVANDELRLTQGPAYFMAPTPISQGKNVGYLGEQKHFSQGAGPNPENVSNLNAEVQDGPASAWSRLVTGLNGAKDSVTSIEWSSIPDTVTDMIVPDWARLLPSYISKLQQEFSMAPGSLGEEIWEEAHDLDVNPEVAWDAHVRVSNDLCKEEQSFTRKRRQFARVALAKYLELPDYEVNIEDVPTIAICGSGGGLRALISGAGYFISAKKAGLFDCVTYTAGVSGSCWLQALYNSTLAGCRHEKLVEHIKARTGVHIAFPPAALALLTSAPTNKFLLRGMIEKLQADPDGAFGLVDIYGLLLGARFLVPKGELGVNERDLKLSDQRGYIDGGRQPLPIYTAVRHEIPLAEAAQAKETQGEAVEKVKEKAKDESWFQWFEFTPYELWCEEFQAGIPTWAVGRKFDNGRNLLADDGLPSPQLKMPFLMGIWGSAFCASLSHYYQEFRPLVGGLTSFIGIDKLVEDRNEDLIKVHPIDPGTIPNYVLGMKDKLPDTCPESIFRSSHLQLMDAGMSNNLPIYPLLRPGRDVDILIAFDASAQIKSENWLSVVDGYARQRGIKGWPIGAGWPTSTEEIAANVEKLEQAQADTVQEAQAKIAEARDEQQQLEDAAKPTKSTPQKDTTRSQELGYCTVWVGTTEERTSTDEPPPTKKVEADWELMHPHAGITVVYFPLLPNDEVAGVDPDTTDFMSTWNFVYSPEQVDKVVALARANFRHGQDQTKATVRAVYERKKKVREQREAAQKAERRRRKIRLGILGKKGEGDHFS
ncbi:MAG: hypothetical protein M1816_002860 [Peltula sp. TS41687]|nr:MAG: hypothetical protein M1816_002860 [Peltula sp. TS41687]